MTLTHHGRKLILCYERTAVQKLACTLYALTMSAFVLLAAVYAGRLLLVGSAEALTTVLLFLAVAAFGCFNVVEALRDADCETEFDLAARTVTLTRTGWLNRTSGPVSFHHVSSLDSEEGFVGRQRGVIARLTLKDGSRWQLGYDNIWVRHVSSSGLPALLGKIRSATGFRGKDAA